jgi:hypothetical protein
VDVAVAEVIGEREGPRSTEGVLVDAAPAEEHHPEGRPEQPLGALVPEGAEQRAGREPRGPRAGRVTAKDRPHQLGHRAMELVRVEERVDP